MVRMQILIDSEMKLGYCGTANRRGEGKGDSVIVILETGIERVAIYHGPYDVKLVLKYLQIVVKC